MKNLDLIRVGLAERNTVVMRRFESLDVGDRLEIVTDAPPWVLYHQLRTERLGEVGWRLVEEGPERWVVEVTRLDPAAG